MNCNPEPDLWHDTDLAAYLDGELEPDRAGGLAGALRTDPALRARLNSIRAADAAVLAASSLAAVPRPGVRVSRRAGLAVAAMVALTGAGALWALLPTRHIETDLPRVADEPLGPTDGGMLADAEAGDGAGDGAVIRTSLGAVRARVGPLRLDQAGPPALVSPLWVSDRSRRGNDARASSRPASGLEAADPFEAMARTVRSPEEARSLLDRLSAADQLRACAVWAQVPRARPLAFARLAELIADPAHSEAARGVAGELALNREMVPWLRMHGLITDEKPGRPAN